MKQRRKRETIVADRKTDPVEEEVGQIDLPANAPAASDDQEEGATSPMPLIGEKIGMLGKLYRCVSIQYADEEETRGAPEIRVRYKRVRS